MWRFQLPYHKLTVPEQQHSIFASLWRFYLTAHTVSQGLLFLWMFYSKGGTTFILAPRISICQGTFEIVPQEVLWSIWGPHQTLWRPPLPNVTWHSGTWSSSVTPLTDKTLHQFMNLSPNWTLLPILTFRSLINNGGNQLLYRHFNLPDHSVLSMKVRIIEKIYHPTNKPINSCTPFRRKREEYWIRQLGTAAPYGCNDNIDSIGNLTSPGCQSVNVLNLFDRTSRRHQSHASRRYNKPQIHNVSFDGLMPFVNLQLGLHHIRTRLYSLPLKTLHVLYESTLTLHFTDVGSPEHRLQGIILDISSNRLFKAVRVCDSIETTNRPFLKIKFANKGIDALNLSNILNQKSVQSNIPPYFEYKESPCISYSYISSVATKNFNYKTSLQQIDFQSLSQNPLPCSCSGSEFLYAPCGHIVTGDLNIVRNDKLRDLLRKGPKYREPVSFHGTRTSTLSWMHAKRTPDGGRRKRMSNSTLFLNGLSRSVMCLNAESDDLNILSTSDTSPFLVTLMLSQSFPVSMRTLS